MNLMLLFGIIIFSPFEGLLNEEKVQINQQSILYDSAVYRNKVYKVVVFRDRGRVSKVKIINIKNLAEYTAKPELILIEGVVPEGTSRIDYNNPKDVIGYVCDSSYQYFSNRIKFSFAMEKGSKRRLDLTIYDSKVNSFKNGDHTLVKK